ncbi:protein TSSC4 [Esox lucius]|uniref:U5 small nuclear ribonucleoprotein TSSC4 n=1 Tax=Esox lucius TaxID=8010 RepID=A0AAY5L0Z3_ESOLU|nr:protein TSSC4 [Esox lucius]
MCEQEEDRACPLSSDTMKLKDDLSLIDSDPDECNVSIDPKVEDLSSSSDDEEHQNSVPNSGPKKPAFSLTGGSSSFSSRSQSIFDCLESAAKLASSHIGLDNGIDGSFTCPPPHPLMPTGKKYQENVGKLVSKPTCKGGVPDYLVNPERWTRYSLEDVPETSDHKNKMVAQQYIQSLQKNKSVMAEDPEEPFTPTFNQGLSSSSEHKIVFSKPSRGLKDCDPEGNKLDQPKKSWMGLSHLDEEEEEGIGLGAISPHRLKESEKKRKWTLVKDEESGSLNDGKDQTPIGFIINRKVNRKNFRKTSEKDKN